MLKLEGGYSPQGCSRGIHNREKLEGGYSPQGCSRGIHNRDKPAEPIRPEIKPRGDPCVIQAPKPLPLIHRPSGDEPLVRLQQLAESSQERAYLGREDVKIGTSCKNGGCSKVEYYSSSYSHHFPVCRGYQEFTSQGSESSSVVEG
uniref:Uncharacterized protein n=1 Tax=Hucho hucho TaxID=62062 RepID=A0A4W5NUT9_9TELE